MKSYQVRKGFWREAIALQGSITLRVIPSVLSFGLLAMLLCGVVRVLQRVFHVPLALDLSPFPVAGVVLGLLLVIRLNAGYDRWWSARTLWGGIVNQSRNLVIAALAYGPRDAAWRNSFVRWTAALPHVARHSLRGESPSVGVTGLIGADNVKRVSAADHMPSFVALQIGELLREANERFGMDGLRIIPIDRERALLIDHIGACERILSTPLPRIYSITIRRFIFLFLLLLPIALLHQFDDVWVVLLNTMLIAYPLLALDQIGVELENPFSTSNLSHLPLDEISAKIERNLLAVLDAPPADG